LRNTQEDMQNIGDVVIASVKKATPAALLKGLRS
jgi:ribosomal protein L14